MSRTTRTVPGHMIDRGSLTITPAMQDYLVKVQRGQARAVSTVVCEHGWPEHISGSDRKRIKRFVAKVRRRQARQDIRDSFMLG